MCAEIWCFWPLTTSTTSDVKNDHAHVITQDICNKFIEIKFSVGCMVFPWLRLLHRQLPVKLLIRLLQSYRCEQTNKDFFAKNVLSHVTNRWFHFMWFTIYQNGHLYSHHEIWNHVGSECTGNSCCKSCQRKGLK